MKVRNLINSRGNTIPNQFAIEDDEGSTYFQSYNSIIVKQCNHSGKTYLDKNTWDYSVTTSKYRNLFLSETTKETKKKIASGQYTLVNLN